MAQKEDIRKQNNDAEGNWTYDAEMSDYGFLVGRYCKLYPE